MRSSAEVAKSMKPDFYLNYYDKGVALTLKMLTGIVRISLGHYPHSINSRKGNFLLDLGAGTGAIVKLMQDYGYFAKGYEVNEWALQNPNPV